MVFDVARLGDAQTFEVTTPHLEVRVLGTVFSVTAGDDETVVRVFEGAVLVRNDGDRRIVRARHRFASTATTVEPLDPDSPLAPQAWQAATARTASADEPAEQTDRAEHATASRAADAETADARAQATDRAVGAPEHADRGSSETSRDLEPEAARAFIASGRAGRALREARARSGGEWRLVEADALRALRRWTDAAEAYERATEELDPARAAQAGYLAASIHLLELDDPERALAALDRSAADTPGSPLEERATALRARALHRLARHAEARTIARRYLDRHPQGGMSDYMHALLHPD